MEDLGFLGTAAVRFIAEQFVEARHLHSAFDTDSEARDLLRCILPSNTSHEFLESAVDGLMNWKRNTSVHHKRQRRIHVDKIAGMLLQPGEPTAFIASSHFEEIVHSDPKIFLDMAKRAQKRAVDARSSGERADKEDKDRRRYAMELASIIEEACLPVSLQIISLDKPELAWLRIWGSRRAKTLRNRFRAWSKYRSWLVATYGVVWPKEASQLVNYVEELIDYGCAVSFPDELMAALSLLEQVGKVPEERRISKDPLVTEHLRSWKVALNGNCVGRGPARPFTVAILIALELQTVNEKLDVYTRFISWLMLVANWASLRLDDLQNIQPETVRLSTRGISFRIARTKTTGPGRLHGALYGFVHRDITITGEDWMVYGVLTLQREDMKFPRDYLAPAPAKNWIGFIPKVVEPPELANYFRMVLSKLGVPRFQERKWVPNEELSLVPETLNLFWTGHSARHFATQAAAGIGISKERRDFLGRWSIGRVGSNAYLHTSRQVVEGIQKEILASLQAESGGYDEEELLEDIKNFAEKQGLIGYRIRRRHKVLPVNPTDPCFMVAEESEDEPDETPGQAQKQNEEAVASSNSFPGTEDLRPQYFVTISRRNGFRRLHMSGACPVQSWKCLEMEEVSNLRVAAFDAVCLNCKRRIQCQEGEENSHAESESGDDSSSTDSEVERVGEAD